MEAAPTHPPTDPTPSAPPVPEHHRAMYFVAAGIGVGALAAALVFNETAREVAETTFRTILGFVSTPFILESTVALFALFIVLAINKHRLEKDGDGWVYMMVQEGEPTEGADVPTALAHRMQGTVMTEKPEAVDEVHTERSLIEGYLELGMAAEARKEIHKAQELPDDAATMALWVRVLASNLDTQTAQDRLGNAVQRFAGQEACFIAAAREQAAWFRRHLPAREVEILLWESEAARLAERHA